MLIEIILTDGVVAIILIVLAIILISFFSILISKKNSIHKLELDNLRNEGIINERDTQIQKIHAEMQAQAQEKGMMWFEQWKKEELQKYIKVIEEAGDKTALAKLNQWIIENEERIRKDAANRSVRNVLGKVTEHLIPFSEAMKQFNPKDIRFIGSPIDLIVFEGAEELKKDEVVIHFIEVKTGTSALSKRQQLIRDAVKNKRIEWLRVDMKSFGDEVNAALAE